MLRFENISSTYFFLIIPVILITYWLLVMWRNKTKQSLGDERLITQLTKDKAVNKPKIKLILRLLAIACLVVALINPQIGSKMEKVQRQGANVMIALDVSKSMLAEDIKPNRLERAKRKIADLLNMLKGDRVGLVAFAGTSFVQCPLTLDYSAARIFLNAIDTDLIPIQGTALGDALRKSIKAFRTEEKKSKAIILITDGEDQSGLALEAAKEAREAGVKVFTIGIGKEIGAPLPNPDKSRGFLKNKEGEVILTKLDETTLQKISLETGGSYVRSVTGDIDLKTIYFDQISQKVDKKEFKSERRKIWQERFQWFIFSALLFLLYETNLRGGNRQSGS